MLQIHLCAVGGFTARPSSQTAVHRLCVWVRLLLARRPWLLTVLGADELGRSPGGKRAEVSSRLILYPLHCCKCESHLSLIWQYKNIRIGIDYFFSYNCRYNSVESRFVGVMKFIWPLEIQGSYNQVLIRDDACSGEDKRHLLGTSCNIKKYSEVSCFCRPRKFSFSEW